MIWGRSPEGRSKEHSYHQGQSTKELKGGGEETLQLTSLLSPFF
jgi:hypothetical protein